jgi:hypothetical protein
MNVSSWEVFLTFMFSVKYGEIQSGDKELSYCGYDFRLVVAFGVDPFKP